MCERSGCPSTCLQPASPLPRSETPGPGPQLIFTVMTVGVDLGSHNVAHNMPNLGADLILNTLPWDLGLWELLTGTFCDFID